MFSCSESANAIDSTQSAERIIVSLTSYPARIESVAAALESIIAQSKKPDLVALYLASDQFPGKDEDLPSRLLELQDEGSLLIKWVDEDLKPHKKYFYALQEYPGDLIITIDDDLIYPPDMIESLCAMHYRHPDAVIASRAHLILLGSDGAPLPYQQWDLESDALIGQPSMRLLATGGAGTLYPAHLFSRFPFDGNALLTHAPHADDLWLKGIEAALDIPVVLCRPHRPLQYLPDTQDVGLFHDNLEEGANDTQWENMNRYFADAHGIDANDTIREWSATHNRAENDQIINYFNAQANTQKNRAETAEAQVRDLYASRTWRTGRLISAPLRFLRGNRR